MKSGDMVAWKWANGLAEGKVKSVHHEKTEIVSNGKHITRNGTHDNPAIVIEHKSGHDVLKLSSELQQTNKD